MVSALAFVLAAGVASASTHQSKPLIKSLSYKPIGNPNTETNPQATYKVTVRLFAHAPSVELDVTGNHGAIDTSILFPKSYSAGTHHLSIKSDALPAGRFKVALTVNLPGDHQLHGSNPATLVVNAAGDGKVPKL
jgi:hypothetical protein